MNKKLLLLPLACLTLLTTGCNKGLKSCELDYVNATSFVKEEVNVGGAKIFFLIFGNYRKNDYTIQRYIFVARNGPRNSFKINKIDVCEDYNGWDNRFADRVYFQYTSEGEKPSLDYETDLNGDYKYYLHVPRETVLEIAENMFI